MKTEQILFITLVIFLQMSCQPKDKIKHTAEDFPFVEDNWIVKDVNGAEQPIDTMFYEGKMALHLPLGHVAYLNNKKFKNFEIEFDMIGFVMPGFGFRDQENDNYELIYLRINSNNKKDALQYLPIYNGSLPWQLYNYPKYEANATFAEKNVATVPLTYEEYFEQGPITDSLRLKLKEKGIDFSSNAQVQKVDESTWGIGDVGQFKGLFVRKTPTNWELWNIYVWSHIKVVVIGNQAIIYVENMDEPKLIVNDLKHETQMGSISLRNQFFDAFFTEVSIKKLNDSIESNIVLENHNLPINYLNQWVMSSKFILDESNISSQLDSIKKNEISWRKINSDDDGLVNLSRFFESMKGTVALKTTLYSDSERKVNLNFGFAKKMVVMLNDQVIFNNTMDTTKDEGRVFVDNEIIDLELQKGDNNLYLLITGDEENEQNWGFIAKLENMDGISVK